MRIDSIIHSYSHLKSLAELLVIFSGSRETLELLTSRDTGHFFAKPPNEDEHACEAGPAASQNNVLERTDSRLPSEPLLR